MNEIKNEGGEAGSLKRSIILTSLHLDDQEKQREDSILKLGMNEETSLPTLQK